MATMNDSEIHIPLSIAEGELEIYLGYRLPLHSRVFCIR